MGVGQPTIQTTWKTLRASTYNWNVRLGVAGAAKDAQVENGISLSVFTRKISSRLAGNHTPTLTSRRTCCLGAPIALLWRFRELPEDLAYAS